MLSILHFLLALLFSFQCNIANNVNRVYALTSPQDIKALKAFKASIKPNTIPQWSCLASWDFTSTDPCALPRRTHFTCGITCSPDSTRVTQLSLDSVGYCGQLTPLISQLTNLTILNLNDNNFYGSIPTSLSSLTNLEILILRSNSFSDSVPASIVGLKDLQILDLSRNSLSGYLPKSLDSLSSLKRLDFSYNNFSGSLPKLPLNLLELAMKANSLSGSLQSSSFDGLNQLAVIELSQNIFVGPLESWLFLLPSLQQLNLANNSLTRVYVPRPANNYSDLVAVDLGFNKIEGNLPVNFAAYPFLSSLSMRHNSLRGTIPSDYGHMKTLKRLFLDGNFLNGTAPPELFTGGGGTAVVSGSLGDNCLQECPGTSSLCSPSQKPSSVCKQAYYGKPRSY